MTDRQKTIDRKDDLMWVLFSFDGVMSRGQFLAYNIPLTFLAVFLSLTTHPLIPVALLGWPGIVMRAKRMHDRGMSGWWQIPYNFLDGATIIGGTLLLGLMPPKKEGNRFLEKEKHLAKANAAFSDGMKCLHSGLLPFVSAHLSRGGIPAEKIAREIPSSEKGDACRELETLLWALEYYWITIFCNILDNSANNLIVSIRRTVTEYRTESGLSSIEVMAQTLDSMRQLLRLLPPEFDASANAEKITDILNRSDADDIEENSQDARPDDKKTPATSFNARISKLRKTGIPLWWAAFLLPLPWIIGCGLEIKWLCARAFEAGIVVSVLAGLIIYERGWWKKPSPPISPKDNGNHKGENDE
jgi:hypothetical protein